MEALASQLRSSETYVFWIIFSGNRVLRQIEGKTLIVAVLTSLRRWLDPLP